MTVLLPCGRTLSKQLFPRSGPLLTRLSSSNPTLRVSYPNGRDTTTNDSQCIITRSVSGALPTRSYATAARPAGRPKAHTGRTPAKRTTKKATPAKKATTVKKTATTRKAAPKKKAASKKKAVAKAKPKPRVKKEPSAASLARKASAEKTALKKKALLTGGPKRLPDNAWQVCFVENGPKKGDTLDGQGAKQAAQVYKNISPEEHERLNRVANENKAKNEAAHQNWVGSYTPLEIKEANHARDALKRADPKSKGRNKYAHIKDDRLVKQPPNPYALFLKDRVASGDMNGMRISEIGKLVGREFKEMSGAQKKTYDDRYAAERNRYYEEFKTVYGYLPASAKGPSASASL